METFDDPALSYVDTVNSNLICCICRTPFVEPVVLEACGHTFCERCITQAVLTKPTCPVDRSTITSLEQDIKPAAKLISNMVNELLVYCPNKDDGCSHVGQRQLLAYHLKEECEYVKLECRNAKCGEFVLKKDLETHMEKYCQARVVHCDLCKKQISAATLEEHSDTCPTKSIECPHCHTSRPLLVHDAHLGECPERPVLCTYSDFGCLWGGRAIDLSEVHLVTCPYEPLKDFLTIYKRRTESLEHENSQLRGKVQELSSTVESLQEQITTTSRWLSTMFPTHFVDPKVSIAAAMNNIDMEHTVPPQPIISQDILFSDNERIKSDLATLTVNLSDLELRQNVALMTESLRMQEEVQSLKSLCYGMRMQMHYLLVERRSGDGNPPPSSIGATPSARSAPASVVGRSTQYTSSKGASTATTSGVGKKSGGDEYIPRKIGSTLPDAASRQDTKL